MRKVIGRPGEEVRMVMDALTDREFESQLHADEVLVDVLPDFSGPAKISIDGLSVEPITQEA